MDRFGRTAIVLMTVLAWVAPSQAYKMVQVPGSGQHTIGTLVDCDDPQGFVHWHSPSISFRTASADAAKVTAVQAALNTWTNVAGASHVLSYAGTVSSSNLLGDGINSLSFVPGASSLCTGDCLAVTVLSVTMDTPGHEIQEADVLFNMAQTWNTNGSNVDVQAVATHELGHALGIHHSSVSGATMKNPYPNNTSWRSLASDDVQALQCSEDWYVSPIYEGVHETTNCREIKGWARNTKRPNGYAWVHPWNGNLSSRDALANLYRPDVGYHGYNSLPPGFYRSGNYHTITVKFPNGVTSPRTAPPNLICQVGIFKTQTPASFIDTGGLDWSVGNVFSSEIPGYVTHLRYYKAAEEAGVHTLKLWTETGQFLASVDVNFGSPGTAGWKTGKLSGNGVQIQAGTRHVVTVTTSTRQSKTDCGFSSPITNGPITGHGGRWQQGNGIFPGTTSCANFWTDVYFDQ